MSDIERGLRELSERVGASVGGTAPPRSVIRRARLRRITTSLGAVLALAIAGVGGYVAVGSRGEPSYQLAEADVLSIAAAATEQQGSAKTRFEMSMEFEGDGFSSDVQGSGTGEIDFRAESAHIEINMSGPPTGISGEQEIIFVDGVQYTKDRGDPESKWVKLELPSGMSGNPLMPFAGGEAGDPSQVVSSLREITGDIRDLGIESVDGVSTTHYQATPDWDRVLDEMKPGPMGSQTFRSIDELGSFDFEPMDVWVDAEGLLRQMSFGVSFSGKGSFAGSMRMSMTTWMYDYGVEVDIIAPDPSEVTDDPAQASSGDSTMTLSQDSQSSQSRLQQVFGPEGISGPWLMVPVHKEASSWTATSGMLCVAHVSRDARRADVIDESNSRSVARVEIRAQGSGEGFGCIDDFEATQAQAILDKPTDYTLRISSRSGEETIVELERLADS